MKELAGKVAIVTGGGRGIGREIVLMLAREGVHVAFNYLKNKGAADTVKKEAERYHVKCLAAGVDVRDYAAVKSWVDKIREEWGRLDILINNAGIIKDKALMMMAPEDWHDVMETNLDGLFYATRACIVTFLKQKNGQIINVSSVSGIMGLPGQTNYSAAKGGINAFTKALAREVSPYGIRVNAVAPGFIETEMLKELNEQKRAEILKTVPLGRMGTAKEVAHCVKFLLSDHASYITGQVIQVDGGLAMR